MTGLSDGNLSILLVEDNAGDVILFRRAIQQQGRALTVHHVKTGEEALTLLRTDSFHVDLIFLDLNLPRMSGMEVLKELKSEVYLRGTPVMILSSSSAPHDVNTAYSNFATGYIVKPNDLSGYYHLAEFIDRCWFGMVELPSNTLGREPSGTAH